MVSGTSCQIRWWRHEQQHLSLRSICTDSWMSRAYKELELMQACGLGLMVSIDRLGWRTENNGDMSSEVLLFRRALVSYKSNDCFIKYTLSIGGLYSKTWNMIQFTNWIWKCGKISVLNCVPASSIMVIGFIYIKGLQYLLGLTTHKLIIILWT